MLNVLIADDNVDYAINLMNYINKDNSIVRVCNIAKDGKKTIDILNNENNIDIILLDYQMPIYNGLEVLEKIENKDKYVDSCIIISGEIESVIKMRQCDLVHSILFKTLSMEDIKNRIMQLVEYKEEIRKAEDIDKRILNELLFLNYNISLKGTKYLTDTIKHVYDNRDYLDNLEKFVYPNVAQKYNEKLCNIKCRIGKATTLMYYNCEIEKLKEYFNLDIDIKPKLKTVIETIVRKIS